MKTFLLTLAGFFAFVFAFVYWRIVATQRAADRRSAALLSRIEPAIATVLAGGRPDPDSISALASDPATRNLLFWNLHELGRGELFPAEHRTLAAIGESDLVFWLLHPNELAAAPDEIELVKEVERELGGRRMRFLVFRYRVHPPHWAAGDGWMAGVAGPYCDGEEPLGPPGGVFSEFEPIDSRTPEQHVDHVVQRIYRE